MKKISEILGLSIDDPSVMVAAKAQTVMRRWEEAVGPTLAEHSTPDRFEHGVVWVAASGSSWAQELRLRQTQILARLNAMAGEDDLFQKVRVGTRRPRV